MNIQPSSFQQLTNFFNVSAPLNYEIKRLKVNILTKLFSFLWGNWQIFVHLKLSKSSEFSPHFKFIFTRQFPRSLSGDFCRFSSPKTPESC